MKHGFTILFYIDSTISIFEPSYLLR